DAYATIAPIISSVFQGRAVAMMGESIRSFGRYRVLGTLGAGGFATVYRAEDPLLGRAVALKVLRPYLAADAEVSRRFIVEARALVRQHRSNVLTVQDVDADHGQPFFAMDLIDGQTLATLLA